MCIKFNLYTDQNFFSKFNYDIMFIYSCRLKCVDFSYLSVMGVRCITIKQYTSLCNLQENYSFIKFSFFFFYLYCLDPNIHFSLASHKIKCQRNYQKFFNLVIKVKFSLFYHLKYICNVLLRKSLQMLIKKQYIRGC